MSDRRRDLEAEGERNLPIGYRTAPLDHWTTIAADDDEGFYGADHGRCVECGLLATDHYRRTMLDDIYQLGYRQIAAPFELYPELPLFLSRRVALV
jgi:hypothetical protein